MGELVFFTQNIFGGGPGWRARRKMLAKRIRALAPDVIGLQEVHAKNPQGTGSQAHELAALAGGGYHVDFAPGRVEPDGSCEGVALLHRGTLRDRAIFALSLDPGDFWDRVGQRVVLCSRLSTSSGILDVLVTHLSLSPRARVRTIDELMRFAARERERSGSIGAVLLGDLNATPRDVAIQALKIPKDPSLPPWVDLWREANPSERGGATWPAFAPWRRIDYILACPKERFLVKSCQRDPLSGSDHRGVIARLRLVSP